MKRFALWLLLLLCPCVSYAHTKSASYSSLNLDEREVSVVLKVALLDLQRAGFDNSVLNEPQNRTVLSYFIQKYDVFAAEDRCALSASKPWLKRQEKGWLLMGWTLVCRAPPDQLEVGFVSELAQHVHFVRMQDAVSNAQQFVVRGQAPRLRLVMEDQGERSALHMLRVGGEHILSGWDHVLFVILLVIGLIRMREVLGVVTGFTVGHSVTLAATVLGWVEVDAQLVEVLIAVSIGLVALENVWLKQEERGLTVPRTVTVVLLAAAWFFQELAFIGLALFSFCYLCLLRDSGHPQRYRWCFASLFGLVHGFGFAGALLSQANAFQNGWRPLLFFNLGVELGQLVVLVLILPLLLWVRRLQWHKQLTFLSSAVALGVAAYWSVARLLDSV